LRALSRSLYLQWWLVFALALSLSLSIVELSSFPVTKSKISKFLPIKKDPKKSFEECYIEFTTMADKVITDTDGKINMYKTGSIATTALNLFFDMTSVDVDISHLASSAMSWVRVAFSDSTVRWRCSYWESRFFSAAEVTERRFASSNFHIIFGHGWRTAQPKHPLHGVSPRNILAVDA